MGVCASAALELLQGRTVRRGGAILALFALGAGRASAQDPARGPGDVAASVDAELGAVTAWSLGARLEVIPWLEGEGLAYLASAVGASALLGVEFVDRYAADLRVGYHRYRDDFVDGSASIFYAALYVSRFWEIGRVDLELGGGIGLSRMEREVFRRANTGVLVAGRADLKHRLGPRLAVEFGLDLHSTSYPTPTLDVAAPADPDGEALARQLGLSLGLSWTLGRTVEGGRATGG